MRERVRWRAKRDSHTAGQRFCAALNECGAAYLFNILSLMTHTHADQNKWDCVGAREAKSGRGRLFKLDPFSAKS
jgi:hypothetical protein